MQATVPAILGSVFLLGAGTALQTSALALRAGIEGFADIWLGMFGAAFYTGMLLGPLFALVLVRNVGYVRTFSAFASLSSAISILHVLVIAPGAWLVMRLIYGLSISVSVVVVESWLNSETPRQTRGRVLGLYSVVFLAAGGLAQPLLGLFPPRTFELFGVTSVLVSLSLLPVALANVSGSPNVRTIKLRVMGIARKSPLGTAGVVTAGFVAGAHQTLGARWAQIGGLDATGIGLLLMTFALGTVVLQLPLGRISDLIDRRRALQLSAGAGTVAAAVLAVVGSNSPLSWPAALLFGGTAMPLYSLAVATVNDQLESDEMVEAAGVIYVFFGVGSIFGPIVGSITIDLAGAGALYIACGGALALFMAATVVRIRISPAYRTRGKKTRYRIVPRTSAIAYAFQRRPAPPAEGEAEPDSAEPPNDGDGDI